MLTTCSKLVPLQARVIKCADFQGNFKQMIKPIEGAQHTDSDSDISKEIITQQTAYRADVMFAGECWNWILDRKAIQP